MKAAWRDVRGLMTRPRDTLEGVLARQMVGVSVVLGAVGYYWRTLQISELLLRPAGSPVAYFAANGLVALGWMALLVLLVHLASRLAGQRTGRWRHLFLLWGYTELPAIVLLALVGGFLALVPPAWRSQLGLPWLAVALAILVLLVLWSLVLKVQAIRVCYGLSGWRLVAVIGVALVLFHLITLVEFTFVDERGLVPNKALSAMSPGLAPGIMNYVALPFDNLTYRTRSPERGEIVGFVPPGWQDLPSARLLRARVRFIGRVVGLPGDEVEVRKGQVYLNHRPHEEPYRVGGGDNVPPTKVPAGHYFVLGDNRNFPLGEYHGGLIPEQGLRGRLAAVGRWKWALVVGTVRW